MDNTEARIGGAYLAFYKLLADALVERGVTEWETEQVWKYIRDRAARLKVGFADVMAGDFSVDDIIAANPALERYDAYRCPKCHGRVGWSGGYGDMAAVCVECGEMSMAADLTPAWWLAGGGR